MNIYVIFAISLVRECYGITTPLVWLRPRSEARWPVPPSRLTSTKLSPHNKFQIRKSMKIYENLRKSYHLNVLLHQRGQERLVADVP